MTRIIASRGAGKTTSLFVIANKNKAIIACAQPKILEERAKELGFKDITFVHYSDMFNIQYRDKKIYIDELEALLRKMSDRIDGYTLSWE